MAGNLKFWSAHYVRKNALCVFFLFKLIFKISEFLREKLSTLGPFGFRWVAPLKNEEELSLPSPSFRPKFVHYFATHGCFEQFWKTVKNVRNSLSQKKRRCLLFESEQPDIFVYGPVLQSLIMILAFSKNKLTVLNANILLTLFAAEIREKSKSCKMLTENWSCSH